MDEKRRTFDRDFVRVDSRECWIDRRKWSAFEEFLKEATGKVTTLVVRAPEVLGDTYREFVMNLAALGDAGIRLEVMPSETRGERYAGIKLGENGEREIIVEKRLEPMITNGSAKGSFVAKPKSVISLLKDGRRPSVVLQSTGPDEVYCQAELLLMFEKEQFRPSSLGRGIVGFYILGAGTIDDFLSPYYRKDLDLERIERYRLEILKRGWNSFVIQTENANPLLEDFERELAKKKEKV